MTPADTSPFSDPSADVPTSLSPGEVRAILAQDLRNILLKVQEKRPLTDREREIIKQWEADPAATADVCGLEEGTSAPSTPEPKWAKTVVDLANVLGIERRTIGNWRQQPGCPSARSNGQYLVAEWREFARAIGSPTSAATGNGGLPPDDKRELENRKLRAEIEEREHKMGVRRGEYTANAAIASDINALVQEASSVLRAKFETELPALYTGNPAHDRALNKGAIDEVCKRLSQPLPCQENSTRANGEGDDE